MASVDRKTKSAINSHRNRKSTIPASVFLLCKIKCWYKMIPKTQLYYIVYFCNYFVYKLYYLRTLGSRTPRSTNGLQIPRFWITWIVCGRRNPGLRTLWIDCRPLNTEIRTLLRNQESKTPLSANTSTTIPTYSLYLHHAKPNLLIGGIQVM